MLPVSVERGVSWLPAIRTIGVSGSRGPEPLELLEGEDDRGVRGADRMEQVAGDDDDIGARREDAVHRLPKRRGRVGLALVDAGRGLAVVLPEAEMEVGEVGEFHG